MKVILTGGIGCGKSTAIRLAMDSMGWRAPRGYLTQKEGDIIIMQSWRPGCRRVCARRVSRSASRPAYEADMEVFNEYAAGLLRGSEGPAPAAIDELGRIELGAELLAESVASLFRGAGDVLAAVQRRALDAWLDIIGRERVDHLLALDERNRDGMPDRIAVIFASCPGDSARLAERIEEMKAKGRR